MPVWLPLLLVGEGLLMALLGIPLLHRKIKPNRLYGFRTPKTLGNETIWYEANAYAGKLLCIIGLVMAVLAAVLWLLIRTGTLCPDKNELALLVLAIALVPLLVLVTLAFRHLKKL